MVRTAKFQGSTKLRNTNFHEIILILIIIAGIISLSFANNMSETIIHNTGKIIAEISAGSGSAGDIQAAVDLAAALGFGIVRIPEGNFNFVEVGESWKTVTVPAGVSIFGAPTERDSNDQVIEWKTVLVMPWDVPGTVGGGPAWFKIAGNSDPNKPSRFSDIRLVGYRDFDPNSTTMHTGLLIDSVINFRVDHCFFKHTCDHAIWTYGHYCCGVIDHCKFINEYGVPEPWPPTIKYGIAIDRRYFGGSETYWEPDISKVIGKYNNYTVFIEDCYFSKWRHDVTGGLGAHIVIRHCIFEHDFGYGTIDMHENYLEPNVGGRAYEVYDTQIIDPDVGQWQGSPYDAFRIRSGGGVFFNITVTGYPCFMYCYNSGWNESYFPHDLYLWNNEFDGYNYVGGDVIQNDDYFLYEPEWYTPYPYPHPLTSS